jgi:hypothetical protein
MSTHNSPRRTNYAKPLYKVPKVPEYHSALAHDQQDSNVENEKFFPYSPEKEPIKVTKQQKATPH